MTQEHDHSHEDLITLIDEDGNEELYSILFTFDSDEFDKQYVLLYPHGADLDEEVELMAFSYIEDEAGQAGELHPIETDKEWELVEEVLGTFVESDE